MSEEIAGLTDGLTKLPQRVASLVELLATLDQKIIQALDSLEQMRTSVSTFDGIGDSGDELVRDLQRRIAAFDERMNRDLDELRAKVADVDVASFEGRLERLEGSIQNIERATVNLDRTVQGVVEALPDFMTKRVKGDAHKEGSEPPDKIHP